MPVPVSLRFIAAVALLSVFSMPAIADMSAVVQATYGEFSVSAPTPTSVFVCHGFGCRYRNEVDFTNSDRATLAQLLAAGHGSAAAERRAVATAGAWFDRRIASAAGTRGHVARAGMAHMNEVSQFDCIDSSRNTTSLLLVLEELKLLRFHKVDAPEARGYLIDGRPPHATAVLTEKTSGVRWSVNSWTRGYGQAPEVMPLAVWQTLD